MAENKKGSDKSRADTVKTSQASAQKQSRKKEGGLIAYLRGVKMELSKVVWPTREELTTDTIVVFACVAFFAVMFWLIDTGFLAALKGILGITLS